MRDERKLRQQKPISLKNVIIWPATPCTLSCPPVMMNAATLLRISTVSSVIWFWMQFSARPS